MAELSKTAQAGTLESNDIMIIVSPAGNGAGIGIDLESNVALQYGDEIRSAIRETITQTGVHDAQVKAVDRGALDCTIRARTLTALGRAGVAIEGELL